MKSIKPQRRAAIVSILLLFLVLGCKPKNESGRQDSDSKIVHTNARMNALEVEVVTNLPTVTGRARKLSSTDAIDLARREAENDGLLIDRVEFSYHEQDHDVWWIGFRGRNGATEGMATVVISERGIDYRPPRHKLEKVEAVQIAKSHAKRQGGSEFKLLYAKQGRDVWLVGLEIDPRVYGGGAKLEVRLSPFGELYWIKVISPGFQR